MVDEHKVAFNPAVELSYLTSEEHVALLDAMDSEQSCLLYTSRHVLSLHDGLQYCGNGSENASFGRNSKLTRQQLHAAISTSVSYTHLSLVAAIRRAEIGLVEVDGWNGGWNVEKVVLPNG